MMNLAKEYYVNRFENDNFDKFTINILASPTDLTRVDELETYLIKKISESQSLDSNILGANYVALCIATVRLFLNNEYYDISKYDLTAGQKACHTFLKEYLCIDFVPLPPEILPAFLDLPLHTLESLIKLKQIYDFAIIKSAPDDITNGNNFVAGAAALAMILQIFASLTINDATDAFDSYRSFAEEAVSCAYLPIFLNYYWPFAAIEYPGILKNLPSIQGLSDINKIAPLLDEFNKSPMTKGSWPHRGLASLFDIMLNAARCDVANEAAREINAKLLQINYSDRRKTLSSLILGLSVSEGGNDVSNEICDLISSESSANNDELENIRNHLLTISSAAIYISQINEKLSDVDLKRFLSCYYGIPIAQENKYRLEFHRAGSTSLILKATNTATAVSEYALKVLKPTYRKNTRILESTRSYVDTYGKGKDLNAPRLIDVESSGPYHVLMEYHDGITLYEFLTKKAFTFIKNVSDENIEYYESIVPQLFKHISDNILEAHKLHKYHHDISLENILVLNAECYLDANDTTIQNKIKIKIIDYGPNYILEDINQVKKSERLQVHISPEVKFDASSKENTELSDYYSLGVLLLEILFRECAENSASVANLLDKAWHTFPDAAECIEILIDGHLQNRNFIYHASKMQGFNNPLEYVNHVIVTAASKHLEIIKDKKKSEGLINFFRHNLFKIKEFTITSFFDTIKQGSSYLLYPLQKKGRISSYDRYQMYLRVWLNASRLVFSTLAFISVAAFVKIFSSMYTNASVTSSLYATFDKFLEAVSNTFPGNITHLANSWMFNTSSYAKATIPSSHHEATLASFSQENHYLSVIFEQIFGFIHEIFNGLPIFRLLIDRLDLNNWEINLSAAIVGSTFACACYAYYSIVFSQISIKENVGFLIKNIPNTKYIPGKDDSTFTKIVKPLTQRFRYARDCTFFAVVEPLMRTIPIITAPFILWGMFIEPQRWAACSAWGIIFIAFNNYINRVLLDRMLESYHKTFKLPMTGELKKRMDDFKQWYLLMFIYCGIFYIGNILFMIDINHDWMMYAMLVFIVNIFKMYRGNCKADGPYIAAFILRCYKAHIRSLTIRELALVRK